MQIEQYLRDLLWKQTDFAALPTLVLSLCLAAILGLLLAKAYVHFGYSLSNRRLFSHNFVTLAVTTTLIISIIRSSIALSLGLVGALSVVRFRAAIKEPEELAYLFLTISIGLGLGAGQLVLTVAALIIILGIIALRKFGSGRLDSPNLYVTISSAGNDNLDASRIMQALRDSGGSGALKRFDKSPDLFEVSLLADFAGTNQLEDFIRRLRQLDDKVHVSCMDDKGLVT